MKINEHIKIIGQKVILVPYESKHVEKYNRWMQSPELQRLTASEPLTLEEEYQMQKSWRNDEDKLTFLIISRSLFEETHDEIESLVGDTNLFFRIEQDDEGKKVTIAEAEIMIAELSCRGQGLGWEAMLLLLKYAQKNISVNKFEAKISIANDTSIKMFKKMKFEEISKSNIFKEITLQRIIDDTWISWLDKQVQLKTESYN